MATFKIVTTKRLDNWRGSTDEEWSNGYHFTGTAPSTTAAQDALIDAVVAIERTVIQSTSKIVRAYFYADPEAFVTRGRDIKTEANGVGLAGDPSYSGGTPASPDLCAVARFRAGQTTKGRPSYVMKWYRSIRVGSDGQSLIGAAVFLPELEKLRDGSLPGGVKLSDPQGTLCGAATVKPFVLSRDMKRRRPRPQ